MEDRIIVDWSKMAYFQTIVISILLLIPILLIFKGPFSIVSFLFGSFWILFVWYHTYAVIIYRPPIVIEKNGFIYFNCSFDWDDIKVFRLRKIFNPRGSFYVVGFILSEIGNNKLSKEKPIWYIINMLHNKTFAFIGLKNEHKKYILFPSILDRKPKELLEILSERHLFHTSLIVKST